MSDYISKEELKKRLVYCRGLGRTSLEAVLKAMDNTPTVNEKDIIRKPFERVVERLEEARQKYQRLVKEQGEKEDETMNIHFRGAMQIVKEEGGIE